jgi:hypothetical protein
MLLRVETCYDYWTDYSCDITLDLYCVAELTEGYGS